ncbi:MAG TPA: long-chain-fatty-acid--CoA ligase [Dehalococcoidia bacterium]|nr:long-chain-fatty-acid--CoA ligase [Dehalococcoidia bacterium]
MNPAEFLTISSAVVPDRDALVSGDGKKRISYMEMASRVNRLTNALQSMGVGIGDRVAVMATNSPEYVEVYYACARLGACFVPINFRAKQEELSYMLNTSDAVLLFAEKRYLDLVASLRNEVPGLREVITLDGAAEGLRSFDDLIDGAIEDEIFVNVDESEPTVLIYTSGTTAMPKGVELTYLNLSLYVVNTMSPADPSIEELDKTLLSVTIAHVAGITAILSSIWGGRTLVILPQFDPELWLEAVERERVTHAFVVPTMLKRLMDYEHFARHDIASLKLITYGAAPMPYEVVCRAIEVFTCDLMNAYGQTESTSSLTYLGPEDHRLNGSDAENAKKLHRLRSVGRPMDDVEVAILDPGGNKLPQGQEGEICVQSARVMKEYIKADDATAAAIVDGWLHTGDIGYLDEDGYLFITGRVKDLIIRGGENIAAGEIEAILDEHPLVEESAIIGVPDPEWGETIKAIVVLDPEGRERDAEVVREDLREHCRAHLAGYKTPAYIALIDELPRNPMGKVLKTDLRRDHGAPDND